MSATPYTADELAAVRPIIEAYNRPESVQRRLLATIDQYLDLVAVCEVCGDMLRPDQMPDHTAEMHLRP